MIYSFDAAGLIDPLKMHQTIVIVNFLDSTQIGLGGSEMAKDYNFTNACLGKAKIDKKLTCFYRTSPFFTLE
ncbi:MAG: hypothetical protein AAGI23_18205 [Bacteroidota bacterium]